MKNSNFHIYPSYFTNESRILRIAEALISHGVFDKIILLGYWKSGLPRKEFISRSVEIVRIDTMMSKSLNHKWLNLFGFLIFYLRVLLISIRSRPQLVNAHSLTVLPLCVFIKLCTGSKVLYDPHELETESNDSQGVRKRIAKIIETLFIKFANHTIVVSSSIQLWYKEKYQINNIGVIRNVPAVKQNLVKDTILRESLNLNDDQRLFIYSGMQSSGRGIESLLEIFKEIPSNHIVFMGYGPLNTLILEYENQYSNIHLLGAVNPNEVTRYVSGADVGISYIENTCLSYYYSLPNKVFEYISAGVPFICSDFPDVRREFEESDVSWFVKDEIELKRVISEMSTSQIFEKKEKVAIHRMKWNWGTESIKLIDEYQKLQLANK